MVVALLQQTEEKKDNENGGVQHTVVDRNTVCLTADDAGRDRSRRGQLAFKPAVCVCVCKFLSIGLSTMGITGTHVNTDFSRLSEPRALKNAVNGARSFGDWSAPFRPLTLVFYYSLEHLVELKQFFRQLEAIRGWQQHFHLPTRSRIPLKIHGDVGTTVRPSCRRTERRACSIFPPPGRT